MLVYVLNSIGNPLMPCDCRKARKLLKSNKAKCVRKEPFTIQLNYGSSGYKQEVNLGVDAGSKHVGISATTKDTELFSAEVALRTDIVDLLSTRRQNRRIRRNRLRYRQPRFLNRVKSKNKGWLAPSIENKIATHLKIVNNVCKLLPISKIIVETASFDIQKMRNPDVGGRDYQNGEQKDFWNVREYVLWRDGHACQNCKGKTKDKILNVHHVISRKVGGNRPDNLVTLCETCHNKYHRGEIELKLKKKYGYADATFMGIMRWTFFNKLKDTYPNVQMTYGYITKDTRIKNGLPKEHRIDARCISDNPLAKEIDIWYYIKQIRKHNRQIHKANILKGGKKKLNQATYEVKGFRLFDKVDYDGTPCFIFGRRTSGYFDLRMLDGTSVHKSASFKKLKLLSKRNTLLTERRMAIYPLSLNG